MDQSQNSEAQGPRVSPMSWFPGSWLTGHQTAVESIRFSLLDIQSQDWEEAGLGSPTEKLGVGRRSNGLQVRRGKNSQIPGGLLHSSPSPLPMLCPLCFVFIHSS